MWKSLFDLVKSIFTFVDDLQKNRAEIKELRKENEQLTDAVKHLAYEIQRISEREQHEREKLELRLEIERLKKQLPPKPDSND
jgi:molecular chaperone GrpE (heat shock protein)